MSRTIKQAIVLGLTIVIGVSLAGCSLMPKEEEALKPPLVKPPQENYSTVNVEKGTIMKTISGSGTFESVSTDISQFTGKGGRIDKILVRAGDEVKKGDVLVQLILDGLDIELKEQQLALEKAKFAFRQAINGDEQVLSIAKLQYEVEQLKYDRLSKQFKSKQLVAGIDGEVVFTEALDEGDIVEAYQTLVVVADPTKLRVTLRVDTATDLGEVEVGMQASVRLNGEEMMGKVVQTPSSSPETLNQQLAEKYAKTLYIELPTLPKDAKIGSMPSVKIITRQRDNVLIIPRNGLRTYFGRNFVRVLDDDKRLREIDVEPGLTGSTEVEIVKGLTEGQLVVLQ
ncbi:efflux RND transporter periplasmic adaptor subunit [Cohnella mopanensis]|uniref:efflux RND transporter periplasmic adaptor subunit n=1 Tax=Cohnella mopanensis TaxID=2911966 RepID=UPI001EF87910|nr:efflux RND transporter periplasmic adaptor subunit [Cohnella mopanensis]